MASSRARIALVEPGSPSPLRSGCTVPPSGAPPTLGSRAVPGPVRTTGNDCKFECRTRYRLLPGAARVIIAIVMIIVVAEILVAGTTSDRVGRGRGLDERLWHANLRD